MALVWQIDITGVDNDIVQQQVTHILRNRDKHNVAHEINCLLEKYYG